MPGAKATFTLNTPIAGQDFVEFARIAPDLFRRKVPSAARRVTRFAKSELKALTPEPAKHPIRWTPAKQQNRPPNTRFGYYSKQKAAYFATNGFGRGIPSPRTGTLKESWEVRTRIESDASGEFTIENSAPAARYVIGKDQQRFHAITGWPNITDATFRNIEDRIAEFASEELAHLHTSLIDDYLERFG
jgi:hypothetical protein